MMRNPHSGDGPVRILFLITSTAGGGGLHAYYLARDLPRSRYALTVAFGPGYPLDAQFATLGIPVIHLPLSRGLSPLQNLRAWRQVRGLIRRLRPDVVISACSIAGMMGRLAAWREGVPVNAFVLHAFASHAHVAWWKRVILRTVERALDRVTTHYIAVAHATGKFGVTAGIMAPEKVTVIHNGVPAQQAIPEARRRLREAWGIAPQTPLIGVVARLERQKGVADFLRAAALLQQQHAAARFVVVGDGPLRAALAALARRLGLGQSVHFAGWHEDVPAVMSALDVFCLSSLWEQFPFSVLEAMAAARPVVATAVDGVPEAITDGAEGWLVPAGDAAAMARALGRCLEDPHAAATMGQRGRQRVVEEFGIDRMIDAYDRCLAGWNTARAGHQRVMAPQAETRAPAHAGNVP